MTATTFCIALTSVHSRPSNGIDRTAWMTPPVTMLAVPIVSRTKPQKMPACIVAAPGSLNILVWTKAYSIRPDDAQRECANGCDGRATAKTRRWRAIARHEEGGRAPEDEEDERVARDLGERLEHRASFPPRPRGRDRVIVRSREGVEGVIQHRRDGVERFEGALRAAGQVDDERPTADADDAARQVGERREARPAARIASASPGTS